VKHHIATETRATRALAAIAEIETLIASEPTLYSPGRIRAAFSNARADLREIIDGCKAAAADRRDQASPYTKRPL
jgi:hypothetical protein